ncbi:hypothetical protein ACFLWA_10470 [Chloroflexota bacterium]
MWLQSGFRTQNCELRYQNLTASGVEVKVEEDTTWDTEKLHWQPEAVARLRRDH